jgi:B12-binding domain/radical SAM domain protein
MPAAPDLPRVALVAVHTRTGVVALNVLTGALRADPRTRTMAIDFARTAPEAVDAVRARAAEGRAVLVAWSFYSTDLDAALEDLRVVRAGTDGCAGVTHVAGGVHATAEPLSTLDAGFDLVALGEGERTIVELVLAAASGVALREVAGVGWLEGGALRSNGYGAREPLDAHPAFNVPDGRYNAVEITRGCVYACSFCQTPFMFKARFRHRSVADTAAHARALRAARMRDIRFLTPTSLSYGSDDTSVNLDAVEALLAAVREGLGPEGRIFFGTFPSEVRPEHVTPAAMRALRRYVANDNLVIGAQSGSQRVLDRTRRGHSVEDIDRAVAVAKAHGFRPNVDFLFGACDEAPEDADASIALMRRLTDAGARIHVHAFMPLPGTPLRDAPAGVIPERVREELAVLEAKGSSYGPWRQHLVAAERLARRRAQR